MRLANEPLANHTTLKVGGPAEELFMPASEEELIETVHACRRANVPWRMLGNGSNLLVRDQGVAGVVIKNTRACSSLTARGDVVEAGSAVMLQPFIRFCHRHELEGMEYLYSVPATIGGAVFMNAGRGRGHGVQISDKLMSVRIFDGSAVREIPRDQCAFSYRRSVFHDHRDWVILGATFRLTRQPREIGEAKVKERMEHVKRAQDWSKPCVGSVFKRGLPAIFNLLKGSTSGGAQFSPKTRNWILNIGNASAADVLRLIRRAKLVHGLIGLRAELEIEVW